MSFGQELKDFTAAFKSGYDIGSDRRDKKWEHERQALNDPIDRDYKQVATEGARLRNKWYDKIADIQTRSGEKNLEWADRDHQSINDSRTAAIFGNFFGGKRGGKPGEVLDGDAPDGAPEADGPPVGGDVGAVETNSAPADTDADASGGADTDSDSDDATVENMSYSPASSDTDVYNRFMQTVYKAGVKNPNGLAAIAATATRESRFSPRNAYGSWSDPSESGQGGTAGGIMSWRGNRYAGLQQFARKNGDDPRRPSPETQAMYLFHEDPSLKDKLNQAESPQQAQQIMNNAWAFAGYNRDSPERRARFSLANQYAEKYGQYLADGGVVQSRPEYVERGRGSPGMSPRASAIPVGGPNAQGMYVNREGYAGLAPDRPVRAPVMGGAHSGFSAVGASGYNDTPAGSFYAARAQRMQKVVHAAVGGTIPAIDDEDPNPVQQPQQVAQALPTEAPVPTQRPMDQPDTSEGNKPDVGYDPSVAGDPRVQGFTKAHEAVLDGMRYSLQEMGLGGGAAVSDPDRAAKMAAYLKGSGAAPKAIIDQAYAAVDPDNELPESERTMAALGMVYDHYTKRGEAGKAKAAAASIVQYQRKLFQQYSAIAKAAIADGDIDAATKAAVKAYSSVPDGQDMKVKKLEDGRYQIDITDEATHKTISKPVLTPQEIGGWAMKVSPGSFDEFIMGAAGVRKQGGGAPSEEFQKLASGMDEGKVPSNADMADLPMSEQKELRMRVKEYQKSQGTGGAKPLTFGENQTAKAAVSTAWEDMASQTEVDDSGNEVPVHKGMSDIKTVDQNAIKSSAANILGTPKNRNPDYNVTEQDAIAAAFMVSQSEDYKVTDKDNGKVVELPDGTEVWMAKPDFTKLSNIYQRQLRAAKKAKQDAVNAGEDSVARRKKVDQRDKDITENPNLFGDPNVPSALQGNTQSTIDNLQNLMNQ